MHTDEILCHLNGVRPAGDGKWTAPCPSHDDARASLSIGTGDDGRTLVHCHANCDTADLLAAMELTPADLFPSNGNIRRNGRPEPESVYDYRDADGALLFQVCRFTGKKFRQRRADGAWNLKGVERVLYRLPELLAPDATSLVFIVEGEKDVDKLRSLGLVATCNAVGAGKWRPEYNDALAGRPVVLLPDNDAPGKKHAQAVAKPLASTAASVRIVELPVADKGDVSDWLDAGHTSDELLELAKAAPEFKPAEPEITPARLRLTDVGNGKKLGEWFGDDLRYVHCWQKWICWMGTHWKTDADNLAERRAKKTAERLQIEAARPDLLPSERIDLFEHGVKSESSRPVAWQRRWPWRKVK